MMRNKWRVLLLGASIAVMLYFIATAATVSSIRKSNQCRWDEQLNSMNYLVMRTSSINLINGIYLTKEQVLALKMMAVNLEKMVPEFMLCTGYYNDEMTEISRVYLVLTGKLMQGESPGDTLRNSVYLMRSRETEIIRLSLLGSYKPGYSGSGCLECHAPPGNFPKGRDALRDTKIIGREERKKTDLAHVEGIFGRDATQLLWDLRNAVDSILTEEQRYVSAGFRCCLIPPDPSENSGIIGQSFVTNEWIEYFINIRSLDENNWKTYKDLFLIPLRDLLEARLPGIRKKEKEERMRKAEAVIEDARKMDPVEFQLMKEDLCARLGIALSIDDLNGESSRLADERKFITAMLLLFPGSAVVYDALPCMKK